MLDRLTAIVPPPARPSETGTAADWLAVEARVGTALPADYKALVQAYGTGEFYEFMSVLNPFATHEFRNLLCVAEWRLRNYNECRRLMPEYFTVPAFPEPGRVYPWATTINGDELYWITEGPPDGWGVMFIETRSSDPLRFPMTTTEFLVALFTRTVDPPLYPEDYFIPPMRPYRVE